MSIKEADISFDWGKDEDEELQKVKINNFSNSAENHPNPSVPEQGVTFGHVYQIDLPGSSICNLEPVQTQDDTGLQTGTVPNGEDNIIFRHNIRLRTPKCECEESESFKSLLYRVNGLEEEVNYLKTQCTQGCCGGDGAAGMDTSCSGHGTYQHNTCSCLCNPGWEGADCSDSTCPDECSDNGRCVNGKCVCYQGYKGDSCSQVMCPDNCNDKGHCIDGKCECFSHFTGDDCSIQKCLNDCIGNGQCVDGQCICDEGFYGEDCSLVFGPQGLRLVHFTDVSLLVEWDPVHGAEYYILAYHPKDKENILQQIQVPNTENSYLISRLSPGVTYIVQVCAVIKELQSEADKIAATTDLSTIDNVRVLGQTEVSVQLDWSNPAAEVDHFRLTYTDPEGHQEVLDIEKSQEARIQHTIMGLFPGTEYKISVQAVKETSEGKSVFVTGATDIDMPNNLITTEVTEDTAKVSWDPVQARIDGYMLRYISADGTSADIAIGRDSTSYRLVGLRPGILHTIYIWAYKGDKVSRKTSTQAETEMDAPTNISVQDESESSLSVSWDHAQAEIDGYVLTYSSSEGSSEEIPVGSDRSSYILVGLKPGVLYTIHIWATKETKVSRKISTQAETELDAPANLSAQDVTESSFSLSWDPVHAEINGYVLAYSSSDGFSEKIPLGPDRTSYMLTSLRPGRPYTVYIWAIKGDKASKKILTNAETELNNPANLLVQDETESSFSLSWDQVQADIDGKILAHCSSMSSDVEIPVGSDSTSNKLTSLSPGVLYTFSYKPTEIDAPADLKATDVMQNSAVLTWIPPLADIEGYIITYRDEDGNMETVENQLDTSERSFSLSGLNTGKRYIVTIMAYRGQKRSKVTQTIFKTVGLLYPFPMDCLQIMKNGNKKSGVYTIYINNDLSRPIEVYCDMDTDGGGWLVLQRRTVGKLDFLKRWRQYIAGFGNMTEEFWIGLEKIYELTNTPTQYELRFDLGLGLERVYAVYDDFKIAPIKQKFKLTIGKYSGTAGDAMTYHQGRPWTTIDSDNDIALSNCALTHRGAWWYKNCHLANLNGNWGDSRHSMGVNWKPWKGHLTSLDFTEMKIRPVGTLSSKKRRSLMTRKSRTINVQEK
ncbi:tenascin-N [Antennarius striatus]|uniref:tenascin-N n=1 Tax=Antennarius striatus TaxID=241820 RepID=UPI0035B147D1